ncbi:hypothetical protein L0P54_00920 [Anaerosalibacter bizertensis]|uniref:Uncharacterized protein n=1 Tax=Anaerosalibacter bizertensis TaxID=932217 RepID=A0A9Q4AAF7_9FIRM|nr:hypothetical protein [Anaerosalibacter bizertensis]MBV1816543.1 hypothetical protein [Bacteroidales bacterium MSK.15.36]MCB5560480.1 hypothetical protein [Anaerosalibacter bizertensis]MCG4563930.1 hypothetical protein [Anaerosalibacter bizertensis]MCG4581532.1 hypothetical protein [Anaerosalibacter bizertensis]MCG4584777.1 hypothetical protein [Anaerosalibacter bizertensis]
MKKTNSNKLWWILKCITTIIVATIQSFGASLLVKKVAIGVIVVFMFISTILHFIEESKIRDIIFFIVYEIIFAFAMSWYVLKSK